MNDPDAGHWTYQVNGLGDVVQQVDANGQCTGMDFDGRGRMWRQRAFSTSACTGSADESIWEFDTAPHGIGALAMESNATASRTPSYDSLGRVVQMATTVDGITYIQASTFDELGRPFQSFFTVPGLPTTGEQQEWNSHGYPFRTLSAYPDANGQRALYREIEAMDARGQVTQERAQAGKGWVLDRSYEQHTGRLTGILARAGMRSLSEGTLQHHLYGYDDLGNVTWREANLGPGHGFREDFSYDALQRLTGGQVLVQGIWSGAPVVLDVARAWLDLPAAPGNESRRPCGAGGWLDMAGGNALGASGQRGCTG